jgi:decaprenylphospho-beta-D-ribofuranose 2-oxidase
MQKMDNNLQRRSEFVSFDGSIRTTTLHQRPDRYRHLDNILDRRLIARGGGYAYSAASFGANSCVLEMTAFDRMLEFDPARSTLAVEAGARVIDVFEWAIRHGLQLPVIPGYPLVTIGGCIAADVHGKNPWRDGTFADWVRSTTIFHPDKGYLKVSSESDPELFGMTCGGFGLTGVIVNATLQLTSLPGTDVDVAFNPVRSLSEAIERLAVSTDDFCYSWHDATPGRSFGRGLVTSGRWIRSEHGEPSLNFRPMTARTRAALPISLWNSLTVRCANSLFYRINGKWRSRRRMNLLDAAFPLARNAAYLAGFGRRGIREFQLLLDETHIIPFIRALEQFAARERQPLIMASLKRFRGRQNSLSPTGTGYLIAVDFFPGNAADRLMAHIDDLMLDMGGQPNLSKDSRIGREVAMRSIRHYETFAERLRRYDPSRRFCSELSERIGL